MNELGEQGWELVTTPNPSRATTVVATPSNVRSEQVLHSGLALMCWAMPIKPITRRATATVEAMDAKLICV